MADPSRGSSTCAWWTWSPPSTIAHPRRPHGRSPPNSWKPCGDRHDVLQADDVTEPRSFPSLRIPTACTAARHAPHGASGGRRGGHRPSRRRRPDGPAALPDDEADDGPRHDDRGALSGATGRSVATRADGRSGAGGGTRTPTGVLHGRLSIRANYAKPLMMNATEITTEMTEEISMSAPHTRGTGGIWKPKGTKFWWVNYVSGGKRRYESTKSEDAGKTLRGRPDAALGRHAARHRVDRQGRHHHHRRRVEGRRRGSEDRRQQSAVDARRKLTKHLLFHTATADVAEGSAASNPIGPWRQSRRRISKPTRRFGAMINTPSPRRSTANWRSCAGPSASPCAAAPSP